MCRYGTEVTFGDESSVRDTKSTIKLLALKDSLNLWSPISALRDRYIDALGQELLCKTFSSNLKNFKAVFSKGYKNWWVFFTCKSLNTNNTVIYRSLPR